jgi:hypothetical protein
MGKVHLVSGIMHSGSTIFPLGGMKVLHSYSGRLYIYTSAAADVSRAFNLIENGI